MIRRAWLTAAIVLYSLGVLGVVAVALALGGGTTTSERWALIAVPAVFVASASGLMRRAART